MSPSSLTVYGLSTFEGTTTIGNAQTDGTILEVSGTSDFIGKVTIGTPGTPGVESSLNVTGRINASEYYLSGVPLTFDTITGDTINLTGPNFNFSNTTQLICSLTSNGA